MSWTKLVKRIPGLWVSAFLLRGLVNRLLQVLHLPRLDFAQVRRLRRVARTMPRLSEDGKRVLIFTVRAWRTHVAWDVSLALALRLRGASPEFFICGGGLPVCEMGWAKRRSPSPCWFCRAFTTEAVEAAGFRYHLLRDLVRPQVRAQAEAAVGAWRADRYEEFTFEDFPLGRFTLPAVRWFLRSGTVSAAPTHRQAYHDFLVGAILMVRASQALLERVRPELIYLLNGMFFEERIMMEVARRAGIPVVAYERGKRIDTLMFSRDQPACLHDVDPFWPRFRDMSLSADEEAAVDTLLAGRTTGETSIERYWGSVVADERWIRKGLGLRGGRPLAVLFTNVLWDTAVQDRETGFGDLYAWIKETIDWFAGQPAHDLAIRVHPAEVRVPGRESAERAAEWIVQTYGVLPVNVRVIPPESDISSYALITMSRACLVFASTVGLEAALMGKPTLMAAHVHYGGKGFTIDTPTPPVYRRELAAVMDTAAPLSMEQRALARRYAYLFFFRCSFPFRFVQERGLGFPDILHATSDLLRPGADPVLDAICDGLLGRREFVLEPGSGGS